MKKFFGIFVVAIAFFAATAQAQNGLPAITKPVFDKGDNIVSLTVGYGSGFGQRLVYERSVYTFLDGRASVGVGAAFNNAIRTYRYDYYGYTSRDLRDYFTLGVVGSFHYQFIDKLDTYVQIGLGGGAYISKDTWTYDNGNKYVDKYTRGIFDWTTTVGARWYFNDNFAVNAEFGWVASSYFMAGVTYKF